MYAQRVDRAEIVREDLADAFTHVADAEAQQQPSLGVGVQVVGGLGQGHGATGEGDGDPGADLDPAGVLGCQRERQEGVVVGLRCPQAIEAKLFLPSL